ncbi:NADP-dependent oxidoreductase [Microbacterium sp. RD1]|uniref:NADP-dependent oxidoreductase n=1 Tax=Microbacterium sp. RD1 TaxID=3457313 RepID=UPI003FA5C453
MTALVNHQLRLARRPSWTATLEDFTVVQETVPEPGAGQIVVRVDWLAFDPAMRGWMNDGPSYAPPVPVGEVMRGHGVGEVVRSTVADFPVGATVAGNFGWQTYVVAEPTLESVPLLEHIHSAGVGTPRAQRVPEGVPATAVLGVLGTTGLTAYFGMIEIARPRPGDVVLISGAAGATGSVAGQLARLAGARTIGIAGGAEKVRWLREVAGLNEVVDYKSEDVRSRVAELAPRGVDVFYDNVGGRVLEAGIANIAQRGTVVMCGGISSGYSDEATAYGPTNLSTITVRSARIEGFIFTDFADRFAEGADRLARWVRDGSLRWAEDVQEGGIEATVSTMNRLFDGKNLGKQLLRVSHG